MKCTLLLATVLVFLTPDQMLRDLAVLRAAWTSLHPGIYRYNTPAQVNGYFTRLEQECGQPMTETKFYLKLSQLAEKIHCGHTYLNPNNLTDEVAKRLLPQKVIPVFFKVINRRFIITHNSTGDANIRPGDEIVSINAVPVTRIIDSLLMVSRSDGKNAIGKKLNNINETPDEGTGPSLFDIYFPLFFNQAGESFNLLVRPYDKQRPMMYTASALTFAEREKRFRDTYGPIPVLEKSWEYQQLNDSTAYMKFGTFAFWNSAFRPRVFVDSIFSDVIGKPGVRNLVIDIRGNEGGDNTGDYILSYITGKPIGCDDPDRRSFRYLSVADSLLPYLDTWDRTFKKPKDPARYAKNELGLWEEKRDSNDCATTIPQPNRFKGNVYLLIDAKNSSAGYEMARDFKLHKLGTLVGETTGGSQRGINGGQFFFLNLPASRFEIDLPLVFGYHPGKPDSGIQPDIAVSEKQSDIAEGRDAVLAHTLQLIRKKRYLHK